MKQFLNKKTLLVFSIMFLTLMLVSCAKKLTITFDTQGGSVIESVEVKKGQKVDKPTDPTKEGYIFIEWQLNGETYDFATKVNEDMTLVALWGTSSDGTKRLSQPKNIKLDGNKVTWDKVSGASSYEVYVNGTKYETTSESYEVNLEKEGFVTVFVVAKSSSINVDNSQKSESVLLEKQLSETEISETLGDLFEVEDLNEYPESYAIYNRLALASIKYGITIEELENMEDFSSLLTYIEEEKTSEFLGFLLVYLDSFIEYQYIINFNHLEEPVLNVTEEEIQKLYESLKAANAYTSTYEKAKDDDKFMNLVLPVITNTIYDKFSSEASAFRILNEILEGTYDYEGSYYYEILRDDFDITFTNTVNGEVYEMTIDEIQKIAEYYNAIMAANDELYDKGMGWSSLLYYYSVERGVSNYYFKKMNYEMAKKLMNESKENTAELMQFVTEELSNVVTVVNDIYATYTTILEYEEKYQEIMQKLENIDSQEALTAAITDARNFALQVAQLVEDSLPSREDLELVTSLLDKLNIYSESGNKYYTSVLTDVLALAVDVVKQMLSVLEEISVADIEALLPLMSNPTDENALETAEKVLSLILEKVGSSTELQTFELLNLYEMFNLVYSINGVENANSLLSIALNTQFTEEEFKTLEEEFKVFETYINAYDFTKLVKVSQGMVDCVTTEEAVLEEVFKLIDYVLDYVSVDHIVKYEKYIKGYLTFLEYESQEDLAKVNAVYDAIKNNLNGFKEYIAAMAKISLFQSDKEMTTDEELQLLRVQLELLKQEITNEEAVALANGLKTMQSAYGKDVSFELFNENYSSNMDTLIASLGKYVFELTDDEKALMNELTSLLPLSWVYPDLLDVAYDRETNMLQLSVKEEIFVNHPNISVDWVSSVLQGEVFNDDYSYSGTVFGENESLPKGVVLQIEAEELLPDSEKFATFESFMKLDAKAFISDITIRLTDGVNTYEIRTGNMDITEYMEAIYNVAEN